MFSDKEYKIIIAFQMLTGYSLQINEAEKAATITKPGTENRIIHYVNNDFQKQHLIDTLKPGIIEALR